MEFTFIKLYGSDVEVMINDTKEVVLFQQAEQAEGHEYSSSWFMDGYVGDELKYSAIGEYEYGSDDFVDLTDIELYPEFNQNEILTTNRQ